MKTKKMLSLTSIPVFATLVALSVGGCSTLKGGESTSGKELAAAGPTILNARATPDTFELNQYLQPNSNADILADVKDFNANVTDVRLRFLHAPLEVPMEKISATTWRARLTPAQLKMLAVSGQTIKYDANIIARDEDGKVSTTNKPIEIAVRAPETGKSVG